MTENKYVSWFIIAIISIAGILCMLAVVFSGQITEWIGGKEASGPSGNGRSAREQSSRDNFIICERAGLNGPCSFRMEFFFSEQA